MYDSRGIPLSLKKKAERLGIPIYLSPRQGKRFFTIYNGKEIHFGSKGSHTYIDHKDPRKRDAWRARHSKIYRGNKPAYQQRISPEYYSWHLLW